MSNMKFTPIVKSLLDTDLYKFNMQQVFYLKHPGLTGEYHFKCRNANVRFTKEMLEEINAQIDYLCTLRFKPSEIQYLKTIRFMQTSFIEMLQLWRPLRNAVSVSLTDDGELVVRIKGTLWIVSHFEIYLLAIINEVYFRMSYNYDELYKTAIEKLEAKIELAKKGRYNFKFADFGTRRRLSSEFMEYAIKRMIEEFGNSFMIGTSNVYFAMKYHLLPVGTYAHEFVQAYQGIGGVDPAYSNREAIKEWREVYGEDNGIALTDTITTDCFLLDFDRDYARLYKGVRHDSGDPYGWGEKIIAHYQKLGIDPKTKTLLFSDSLNFDKAQKIYDYFKERINVNFGIGTFFTNDTNVGTLNIVIKLQLVDGNPVAKLSDCDGKTMSCDSTYVEYLGTSVTNRLKRAAYTLI